MPIRCAITISLVPETRGGPFVFSEGLATGCQRAGKMGFDAVEIFPPGPESLPAAELSRLLAENGLRVAAIGTGAGWVLQRLQLCHPDSTLRSAAREFIRSMIDAAGRYSAPAIIGSMQGRWDDAVPRDQAVEFLAEALNDLGEHASRHGVPLLYEPLNRYETNLFNTLNSAATLLTSLKSKNVRLLADLFHANLEEADIAAALRRAGGAIGHVHWADSNRWPAGSGHTDFPAAARALADVHYQGFISAECFPLPDADTAAQMTIDSFRRHFR